MIEGVDTEDGTQGAFRNEEEGGAAGMVQGLGCSPKNDLLVDFYRSVISNLKDTYDIVSPK